MRKFCFGVLLLVLTTQRCVTTERSVEIWAEYGQLTTVN